MNLPSETMKTIRYRLSKYQDMPDFEDALQEAYIQAWKDQESGKYTDKWHIVNRAVVWGRNALFGHRQPTGHITTNYQANRHSTQGTAQRERIVEFRRNFYAEHGRYPYQREIAVSLGMSRSNVGLHLKRIQEGRNPYVVESESGRIDAKAYTTEPLSPDNTYAEDYTTVFAEDSFEEGLVSDLAFEGMLSGLTATERQVMVLKYVHDMTELQIKEQLGLPGKYTVGRVAERACRKIRESV